MSQKKWHFYSAASQKGNADQYTMVKYDDKCYAINVCSLCVRAEHLTIWKQT